MGQWTFGSVYEIICKVKLLSVADGARQSHRVKALRQDLPRGHKEEPSYAVSSNAGGGR